MAEGSRQRGRLRESRATLPCQPQPLGAAGHGQPCRPPPVLLQPQPAALHPKSYYSGTGDTSPRAELGAGQCRQGSGGPQSRDLGVQGQAELLGNPQTCTQQLSSILRQEPRQRWVPQAGPEAGEHPAPRPGTAAPALSEVWPSLVFPGGAGLWGDWAEAQDPTVPRGPWPHLLLPAQRAPGGLGPPEPGGAQGHPAAGRGWWQGWSSSWDRPGPPVPVANPSARFNPWTRGKGMEQAAPPEPPVPPPSSPRAQLTSRGRSHDEGQCQESYAEPAEAHGGGGQRGDPRTSPSHPVPSRPSAVRPVLGWGGRQRWQRPQPGRCSAPAWALLLHIHHPG